MVDLIATEHPFAIRDWKIARSMFTDVRSIMCDKRCDFQVSHLIWRWPVVSAFLDPDHEGSRLVDA